MFVVVCVWGVAALVPPPEDPLITLLLLIILVVVALAVLLFRSSTQFEIDFPGNDSSVIQVHVTSAKKDIIRSYHQTTTS
ncbi:MAG: hypothetical protein WBE34_05185 [Candidatus Nitrosopolaris sp.]